MKAKHLLVVLALSLAMLNVRAFAQGIDPNVSPVPRDIFATTQPATGPATRPSTRPSTRPATQPAKIDTLDDCFACLNTGQYAIAVTGFKKFVDKAPVAASIGMAGALRTQGKYKEAIEALKAAATAGEKDASWHVAMFESLRAVGQYADSLTHAAKANALRVDWAPAIFAHGQALEILGKKKDALVVYASMDKVLAAGAFKNDARSMTALGQIMERHAVLSGRKASDQASNILQNYLQESYLKIDKKYWPANLAAGMFLLTNHRPVQAGAEFKLALATNPSIPEVFVGYGASALSTWQFEACMQQAEKALGINPNCVDALLLKAACMMQWRKFDQVAEIVEKALAVNPNSIEANSLMAALQVRQGSPDKAKPYAQKVHAVDPNSAVLPATIAEWLASGRQFKESEPYFQEAIKLAPELAEPLAGLGLMYMQTGQEEKARETLKKANAIDDFRADLVNYLNLLDKLLDPTKYLVKETDHFIVKVGANEDQVLIDQVSDFLEKIYEEVCTDYSYRLEGKTLVEFLSTHSEFSVRISGRGWVPTVGACTGNVIAMAPPTKDRTGGGGTYNWAVVLRHEFTHAVTLAATNNRIPHWFTEACAVFQQPDKRAYHYIQTLVGATRNNQLLPVKEADWGFIRPKYPDQRKLAYAQSEWMLHFIIIKKGYHPTVADIIKGFRDGKTQGEVLQAVIGMTEEQFDTEFKAWAKEEVRKWGFNIEPPADLTKAQADAKAKPDDLAIQAVYAVALYNGRQQKQAEDLAKKILEKDPTNAKALTIVMYAAFGAKNFDEAIRLANRLEDADHTTVHAPTVLAKSHLEKRQAAQAIGALELLKQRQPLDQYAYAELARIYSEMGAREKALPNLLELHQHTMNDPQYARRVAEIYRSLEKFESALEYYNELTYINPYEPLAYEAMAAIYLEQAAKATDPKDKERKYRQAISAAEKMPILEPNSADAFTKAGNVLYWSAKELNNKDMLKLAKERAESAVKINPESQAKQIIEQVDELLKG